ncbi:MAG: M14 family zinc carboxypeptidase [Candidatus Heimdallarchaeaceae archaeon]
MILEKPNYSSIVDTWIHTPLLYDLQYHNTTALWEEIDMFNAIAPEIIDVDVIGTSFHGKEIKVVRITNEFRRNQKAKTLVVSHHHGREQISVEVALRFILHLLTGYGVDQAITDAIDSQEIYVIPTLNPDALDLVVNENDHMVRKNVRPFDDDGDGLEDEDSYDDLNGDGVISWFIYYEKSGLDLVYLYYTFEGEDNDGDGLINEDLVGYIDLNRNYDMFFRDGLAWSDDTLAGNYPGESPFSELETQTFRDFALQHRFAMAYSLHSGTNATYFVKNTNEYLEADISFAMMNDFKNMRPVEYHFNDVFNDPPVANPDYAAGTWGPWMYFERGTLMPITLELYGNKTANFVFNVTEIPIFANSTHVITEWKGINNFYDPEEQFLNDHWDDVQPFFPYLLENTPVLETTATLNSEVDSPGSMVNITLFCRNLSPKLHTVSTVNILNLDETKIQKGEVILADSSIYIDTLFNLPSDFVDSFEFKVKNDYTGYYHYILKKSVTTQTGLTFSVIGVAILFIGLNLYVSKRKRQRLLIN